MSADQIPATPSAETGAAPKAKATRPKAKPAKTPAAKKAAKPSKKPAAVDINKSDEIRKVAAAMKAKGTKPRPSVIVAELGGRGIKVAAAQVSFVLKSMGFRPLRKRRKKGGEGAAAAGTPKAATKKAVGTGSVSIDDLLAAKKAVASLGGSERALEAIKALKRLEG